MADFDLIIVGAGVAGLTAAMVARHHGLSVAVIAPSGPGGQIVNAERIENYPGMPQGVAGHELGTLLFEQAEAAGALFLLDTVEGLEAAGDERFVRTATQSLRAGAVIVAAGSTLRSLGIPGEEKFLLDPSGHIETDIMMRTSLAGVFAAGDIRKNSVAQLAAVAGDGATAAISAFRYLKARA
jgi:thioredoxin reductase